MSQNYHYQKDYVGLVFYQPSCGIWNLFRQADIRNSRDSPVIPFLNGKKSETNILFQITRHGEEEDTGIREVVDDDSSVLRDTSETNITTDEQDNNDQVSLEEEFQENDFATERLLGTNCYKCPMCAKSFKYESYLKRHSIIHIGKKPYLCSLCDTRFKRKGALNEHMKSYHGENPFHCEQCNKTFNRRRDFNVHQRSHTGEKPYSCKLCARNFNAKSDLLRHEKVHTGKRDYLCTICGKDFTRKDNLTAHLKVHSRDQHFKCNICEKQFSRKENLNDHYELHQNMENL